MTAEINTNVAQLAESLGQKQLGLGIGGVSLQVAQEKLNRRLQAVALDKIRGLLQLRGRLLSGQLGLPLRLPFPGLRPSQAVCSGKAVVQMMAPGQATSGACFGPRGGIAPSGDLPHSLPTKAGHRRPAGKGV